LGPGLVLMEGRSNKIRIHQEVPKKKQTKVDSQLNFYTSREDGGNEMKMSRWNKTKNDIHLLPVE